MDDPSAGLPDAGDGARAAMRQSGDYLLRTLKLLGDLMDGEIITALVALGLGQANVAHIDAVEGPGEFDHLPNIPPDTMRRPVSVLSLASSLGLPYETTRRHVEKMVKSGMCVRVKGGVVIPGRSIDNDAHRAAIVANMANLRRLVRGLKKVGVELD